MSALTAAVSGARAAERQMLDSGTAKRPTGGYAYDPDANGGTGGDVEATSDLFSSACKIQNRNLVAREAEVGDRTAVTVRTELHLPIDSAPLARRDVWEITAVHERSVATVGERFRVIAPVDGTLKTARRYEVERVV